MEGMGSPPLTIFSGPLLLLPYQVGVLYSWSPLTLLGARIWFLSTGCLLVLQFPRSVGPYLSCPHSRWKDPGGHSLLFLCVPHGV